MTVSDAERERAIRALREGYARGDLTNEEFEERLNALFSVRTSDELRELLSAANGEWAHTTPVPWSSSSPADVETVERHLSSGEQIEWLGKPDATKHFSRGDVFLIPFSIERRNAHTTRTPGCRASSFGCNCRRRFPHNGAALGDLRRQRVTTCLHS